MSTLDELLLKETHRTVLQIAKLQGFCQYAPSTNGDNWAKELANEGALKFSCVAQGHPMFVGGKARVYVITEYGKQLFA